MLNTDVRVKIVSAGVYNLRQFGYRSVNNGNITHGVYGQFFKKMLEENKGKLSVAADEIIEKLLAEIEENKNAKDDTAK